MVETMRQPASCKPRQPQGNCMENASKSDSTLPLLIADSVRQYGNRPAMGMAFEPPITYQEFWTSINRLALLLKDMGVKKGERVAILGENSPNWAIAYLAIVRVGAVTVPILPDLPESDVHHILTDAGVKLLFVSERQLDKIYELSSRKKQNVITLDDHIVSSNLIDLMPMAIALEKAAGFAEDKQKKLTARLEEVQARDLAAIIYTSGTSGHSKAVMLTHGNFHANVLAANQLVRVTPDWTFLSILPMSHAYEFTIGFLLPLLNGARLVFAGKSPTPSILAKICAEEKPTVICMVPLVMEKIYKKRVQGLLRGNLILRNIVKLSPLRKLIRQAIGRKLLIFFGGHLQLAAIGGAAMNEEVEKFLREARFPYIVGYGLTESAPLLTGGPFNDPTIALFSAGKPVPGVEIKIQTASPDTGIGEIHARGANIMQGYFNNPELTRPTIDADGWLATGDLGFLDDQHNLHIKGRCKSVIVLSHGENIYPEAIEDKINAYGQVQESLVKEADGRIEAMVYLDYDLIDQETAGKSQQEQHAHVQKLLLKIRAEVNRQLPAFSQISRFIERPDPFIKTATHKIKRYLYAGGQNGATPSGPRP